MDEAREFGDSPDGGESSAQYYSGKAQPCAWCGRDFELGEMVVFDERLGLLFCAPGEHKVGDEVTDCVFMYVFKKGAFVCGTAMEYYGKQD